MSGTTFTNTFDFSTSAGSPTTYDSFNTSYNYSNPVASRVSGLPGPGNADYDRSRSPATFNAIYKAYDDVLLVVPDYYTLRYCEDLVQIGYTTAQIRSALAYNYT